MNITFNKAEILTALAAHAAATGISMEGKKCSLVDAAEGLSVTVSIDNAPVAAPAGRKARGPNKPRVGTKKASKTPQEASQEVVAPEAKAEKAPDLVEQAEKAEVKDVPAATPVQEAPEPEVKAEKPTTQKKRMFGAVKD